MSTYPLIHTTPETKLYPGGEQGYVVAFIIFLIIIYIAYKARQWRQRKKGKRERHGLSEDVMENVLRKQNHRCAIVTGY